MYVTWGILNIDAQSSRPRISEEINNGKRSHIPFIPESYELKCSKGMAEKQLRLIKNIFDHSDLIIVRLMMTGRGRSIFDYIYRYLNCSVPFKRALFNQQSKKDARAFKRNCRWNQKEAC